MIWDAVSRAFPTTAMLSMVGGCWSWASSAAGTPVRRATAAAMGRSCCIRTRLEVGAPAPGSRRGAALGLGVGQRPEAQPLTVGRDVHLDLVAASELAHEDLLAERILDVPLDRPLERPGAIALIVPVFDQEIGRGRRELDLVAQTPLHFLEQDGHDLRDVLLV